MNLQYLLSKYVYFVDKLSYHSFLLQHVYDVPSTEYVHLLFLFSPS